MKTVIGDFHVHTLLSPCAEIEMTPHHIVMQAAEYGIQLLAVTDHNASANAVAAIQAGEQSRRNQQGFRRGGVSALLPRALNYLVDVAKDFFRCFAVRVRRAAGPIVFSEVTATRPCAKAPR